MKQDPQKKSRKLSTKNISKKILDGADSNCQMSSGLEVSAEDEYGNIIVIRISKRTSLRQVKHQILKAFVKQDKQTKQYIQRVQQKQLGCTNFSQHQKQNRIWFENADMDFLFDYRFQKQSGILEKSVRLLIHGCNKIKRKQKVQKLYKARLSIQSSKNQHRIFSNKLIANKDNSQDKLFDRTIKNCTSPKSQKLKKIISDKSKKVATIKNDLSKYKLLKCISVGGFSKVYLARSLVNGDFFAAKFIDKAKNKSTNAISLIYNERDVNKMVSHPSIIRMNDFIETQNFFVFIMEYCPGGQLFHQLKSFTQISEDQAKIYFIEILLAIQHLHNKNIVFRDIKPENILLDDDGHVKLTDFGLAKILPKRERTYSYCGSVQYMAPEVILNEGHGFQVDFYCMGILLYQIMVGYPPFYDPNSTPQQIKSSILNDYVLFPQETVLSFQIRDLILKLLKKQPKQRLGYYGGVKQIVMHPWIKRIDRANYLQRKIQAPLKPNLNILNFDQSQFGQSEARFSKKVALQLRRQKYKQVQRPYTSKNSFQARKQSLSESKPYLHRFQNKKPDKKIDHKKRGMSFENSSKSTKKISSSQKFDSYLTPLISKHSSTNSPFKSIQQKVNYKSQMNSQANYLKKDQISFDLIRKLYGIKREFDQKKDTKLRKIGKPEREKENRPFFKRKVDRLKFKQQQI